MRARAHVQKVGWQGWRDTPAMIGTTGKALRLEAFQITVKDKGGLYGAVSVEYRAYVQGVGWQPWRRDGQTAGTTGKALRIEAVQIRLVVTGPAPEPTPTPTPTPVDPIALVFTADIGVGTQGKTTLAKIGTRNPAATVILGDLAYAPNLEQAFCDQVNSRIKTPVQLLAGNHEEMGSTDGYIDDYAACLPGSLPITGTYAREYFFDVGNVRTILVSPDIEFSGPDSYYEPGTAGRAFLENAIRDAKAKGMWTIVGMHHPCLTRGIHTCADTSPAVTDVALAEGVDLVLSGHNHNYERSHQLAGSVAAPVVVDSDNNFAAGAGTVFAVVGNAGHNPRTIGSKTSIWAVNNGTNSPGGFAYGYGLVRATATTLSLGHAGSGGAPLVDNMTITR